MIWVEASDNMSAIADLDTMRITDVRYILGELGEEVNPVWSRAETISKIKKVLPKDSSLHTAGFRDMSLEQLRALAQAQGILVRDGAGKLELESRL